MSLPLYETNPLHVISNKQFFTAYEINQAHRAISRQQAEKEVARAAANPPNELAQLVIKIRRARSEKTIAALKAQIEAITGSEFYV